MLTTLQPLKGIHSAGGSLSAEVLNLHEVTVAELLKEVAKANEDVDTNESATKPKVKAHRPTNKRSRQTARRNEADEEELEEEEPPRRAARMPRRAPPEVREEIVLNLESDKIIKEIHKFESCLKEGLHGIGTAIGGLTDMVRGVLWGPGGAMAFGPSILREPALARFGQPIPAAVEMHSPRHAGELHSPSPTQRHLSNDQMDELVDRLAKRMSRHSAHSHHESDKS
jgi:hypothetical protein